MICLCAQVRHSQRGNEPLLKVWIKTDEDGIVECGHCQCMAGLHEVCSHVGAILFYIEAVRCSKTCTDVSCQWAVPSSINSIPYAKIADIDFTTAKSRLLPVKRGAHHNNDCDMLSSDTDVEKCSTSYHEDSAPSFQSHTKLNANLSEPTKDQIAMFFNKISKYKPSLSVTTIF